MPLIHLICNRSLQDGELPNCEKLAIVTPTLKKPGLDPDSTANYRFISNFTFLSKLIERLACHVLIAYLHEHHLLALHQSAYRKDHSTEIAMLIVASDVF